MEIAYRRVLGLALASELPDAIPTGEVHARRAWEQTILYRFGACSLVRHPDALNIELRRLVERHASAMQSNIDNRARRHPQSRAMLLETLVCREKSSLVRQICRVTRPAFGQRSAAQHGDARRAIH